MTVMDSVSFVVLDWNNSRFWYRPMNRRTFLEVTAGAAGTVFSPLFADPIRTLPPWRPGEMDIHFIYTGVGENTFHIYPDGTTMLLDTGDYYAKGENQRTPFLPSSRYLGGDWVARYIKRIWNKQKIDYLMVSHWHSDHVGDPEVRSRMTADGRRVCGISAVGETFRFGTFFDHQAPKTGLYTFGGERKTMDFALNFLEHAHKTYGLKHDFLKVGACGQIALKHDDDGKYAGRFSIRNICANAVIWNGEKDMESVDLGDVSTKGMKRPWLSQNILSAAMRIDYGPFSFFTGGDVSQSMTDMRGAKFNYEELVGRRTGHVTVCKTNHHAFFDSMSQGFVDAVKAKVYVNNVWFPSHANTITTSRMAEAGGMVFHTYKCEDFCKNMAGQPWEHMVGRANGHVVVRVAPGGTRFKVFVLSAADESMQILEEHDFNVEI